MMSSQVMNPSKDEGSTISQDNLFHYLTTFRVKIFVISNQYFPYSSMFCGLLYFHHTIPRRVWLCFLCSLFAKFAGNKMVFKASQGKSLISQTLLVVDVLQPPWWHLLVQARGQALLVKVAFSMPFVSSPHSSSAVNVLTETFPVVLQLQLNYGFPDFIPMCANKIFVFFPSSWSQFPSSVCFLLCLGSLRSSMFSMLAFCHICSTF